jgi:hypothetical protein
MGVFSVASACLFAASSSATLDVAASKPPTEPLTEVQAEEWVQELIEHFYSHPTSIHPLMGRLRDGSYPDHAGATSFFAHQVFAFARDFRSVCGMTIGKLRCCDDVRDNLIYHLEEENGRYPEKDVAFLETQNITSNWFVGKPHIDLWAHLLKKLGVIPETSDIPAENSFIPEAAALDRWMIDHVRMNSATSNAAMIMGIELWSKDMGKDMLPALAAVGLSREDSIFFELHNVIDDEIHVADIGKDVVSLLTNQKPENSLEELKQHMWDFQEVRLDLWKVLHSKFESMKGKANSVDV